LSEGSNNLIISMWSGTENLSTTVELYLIDLFVLSESAIINVSQTVCTYMNLAPGTKLNRRCETPNLMMIVNTGKQNKDGSQHKDTSKKVNRTSSIYAHDNCDSLRGN